MKNNLTLLIAMLVISATALAQPSHSQWNTLLQKHVSAFGNVDYAGFKTDRLLLQKYLSTLRTNTPSGSWSKSTTIAYWINAYNAFTIELILRNYPLNSINDISRDGKKPWDIAFIKIGDKTYTLNDIEHTILREKYKDPRIHFAVNCASVSCPPLWNKAFTSENLDNSLNMLATNFVNDKTRNKIAASSIQVSQIFNWFKSDFTKEGSLINFLNKYASIKINPNARVTYLDYNWNLNK